jgi:hypothetical protein
MSSITSTVFTTAVASDPAALATRIQTGIDAVATETTTGELYVLSRYQDYFRFLTLQVP